MERILLYKTENGSGEEVKYALESWEEDDGGRDYLLPQGYCVLEQDGVPHIFSTGGTPCALQSHNGVPLLIDAEKKFALVLEREKKLLIRREALGKSLEEVSAELGVEQPVLYSWEQCEKEPDMHALRKLAGALQCEVFDLT